MGKNLTQQKRGRGSPVFRRPGFKFEGKTQIGNNGTAVIREFLSCRAHSAPLAKIRHEDNSTSLIIAPEGVQTGQTIIIGGNEITFGNIVELKNIPEGTSVFNIENAPGDGGKFVKSSGTNAKVVAKTASKVTLLLPSKKQRDFNPDCRACIGTAAGGGRPEKPFYKAGRKYFAMKAKNMYWPSVSGTSMNSVDHPFGGHKSHHKGRPTTAPKNAPPGRKVGMLHPRSSGRSKVRR